MYQSCALAYTKILARFRYAVVHRTGIMEETTKTFAVLRDMTVYQSCARSPAYAKILAHFRYIVVHRMGILEELENFLLCRKTRWRIKAVLSICEYSRSPCRS